MEAEQGQGSRTYHHLVIDSVAAMGAPRGGSRHVVRSVGEQGAPRGGSHLVARSVGARGALRGGSRDGNGSGSGRVEQLPARQQRGCG
jgi:hypothetical protein